MVVAVTLIDHRQRTGMRPLRHIPFHSPAGMEWGYEGSGPADLALAILVDHLREHPPRTGWLAGEPFARWAARSQAFYHHHPFKRTFVAQFAEHWELTDADITAWLTARTSHDEHSE